MTGLEAFVLSDRQCGIIDAAIASASRAAIKGKSLSRDAEGKVVNNMTNEQVLNYWDMATTKTELRVRRLKWLQTMAEHPIDNVMPLAALTTSVATNNTNTSN